MKKITKMLAVLVIALGAKNINAQCNAVANFTYVNNGNGNYTFGSTTTGGSSSSQYVFYFGDYTSATLSSSSSTVSHTYNGNGSYGVEFFVYDTLANCYDSTMKIINVTGAPCVANSNFSLSQAVDSLGQVIPQNWNITPTYPYNITNAYWSWGDGSSSNTLYASHNYANAGNYNICLFVTVSCGASGSTCATYSISKMTEASQIVKVKVIPPSQSPLGINKSNKQSVAYTISPNPTSGAFNINVAGLDVAKTTIAVYNMLGAVVYKADAEVINGGLRKDINIEGAQNGVYFVKMMNGNQVLTKKIVITK